MPALVLSNLSRRFPPPKGKGSEIVAVENLSFAVERGEVFGFLGPNGAGKTTTVRMLAALISPSGGEAWVNGHKVGADNMAIRRDVGLLTESPGLYEALSARRNLLFFAHLYGVPRPLERVETYLRRFDLLERADEPVAAFSKGMKQKLALARALLHEPPILFLDEPTAGLDPAAAKRVREAIASLSGQGRTIFLCTHNLPEAEALCNRIGVLNRGKLVALDAPAALRAQRSGPTTLVTLENLTPALAARVRALPFVVEAEAAGDRLTVTLRDDRTHTPDLVAALVDMGGRIRQVVEQQASLEEVYLSLVQ